MPCTYMNIASCNQPTVVPEREIEACRDKEWQRGVGDTRATGSMGGSI